MRLRKPVQLILHPTLRRILGLAPLPDGPSLSPAKQDLRAISIGLSLLLLQALDPPQTRSEHPSSECDHDLESGQGGVFDGGEDGHFSVVTKVKTGSSERWKLASW